MTLAYPVRLLCLCLSAFFLVHLAAGLVVMTAGPLVSRKVARLRASSAAKCLFALRLFPAACGVFVVAALCIPSYLWLEPDGGRESVGLVCIGAALLGGSIWAASFLRTVRGLRQSRRCVERCLSAGQPLRLNGDSMPAWVTDGGTGPLMLAGLFRPQLFVSRPVVAALSGEELAAALRHESAHRASRDNLKRLAMLLTPEILPGVRGFAGIERPWVRFAEWAADDGAVAGDAESSLALASALVRVARLRLAVPDWPLATSLLDDSGELAARVDRLLRNDRPAAGMPRVGICGLVGLAGGAMVLGMHPGTLQAVHGVLESLLR